MAQCFHDAVSVLQREPKLSGVGRFLADALRTGKLSKRCAGLFRAAPDGGLRLADGRQVTVTRKELSIDHLAGGKARQFIEYRFRCAGRGTAGRTTIELVMGH